MNVPPQALLAAQREVDLSKLPLFHANAKKDTFTAEEWVERVQRAKDAGTWNDVVTTSYVYNALREGALTWYRTLKWSSVDNRDWAQVKQAFLEAYGTTHTSRTTATALQDLKQNNDSVIDYYTRVVEVMSDLQALMPAGTLGAPANPYPPEIAALGGFNALADAIKDGGVERLVDHGAQRMIYFVATQIFVNGLKAEIRSEVMKQNPLTIMNACTMAQTVEKIHTAKKPATLGGSIMEVTEGGEEETPEQLQLQIDELQRRKQWAASKRPWQGQNGTGTGSSFGNGRNYGNGNPGRRNNPAQGKRCHYCKKMNHFQKECKKRARDNAPMVPPPNRVSEQTTGNDSEGYNCHPFSDGQQLGQLDGIFGSLN